MSVLLVIVLIVAIVYALFTKMALVAMALYVSDIGMAPDEDTIKQYSSKALKKMFHSRG